MCVCVCVCDHVNVMIEFSGPRSFYELCSVHLGMISDRGLALYYNCVSHHSIIESSSDTRIRKTSGAGSSI